MNIYVGNLSHDATDEDLRQAFAGFGTVTRATVIKDRISGEPRGFGFVEMSDKGEAENAISGMNGQDLKGRALRVSEARPKTERGNEREGDSGRGRRNY
jgi:RNA recognition motif-containing protein